MTGLFVCSLRPKHPESSCQ